MATILATENFWTDKSRFANAERQYYESLYKDKNNLDNCKGKETKVNNNANPHGNNANNQRKDNRQIEISNNTLERSSTNNNYQRSNNNNNINSLKLSCNNNNNNCNGNNNNNNNQRSTNNNHHTNNNNNNASKNAKNKKNKVNFNRKNKVCEMNGICHQHEDVVQHHSPPAKKPGKGNTCKSQCTLVSEIAKAREHIKNSLEKMDGITTLAATTPISSDVLDRLTAVEKDNLELKKLVENLQKLCLDSQNKIRELENQLKNKNDIPVTANIVSATSNGTSRKDDANDDDGVDLFASDSEDENDEAARIREERLAAYAAKKSTKPVLIAKSSLVLDIKPWDDETDLKQMETEIRKIETDGLLWGASKLVPVAFGIQKLSITCVVEDEKVSIEWLMEEIEKNEDFVQSVDVAAFNKI